MAVSMKLVGVLACLLAAVPLSMAQPFKPGQAGVLPLGNLRTDDGGGPYDLSYLPIQATEVAAGIAAKKDYTDQDLIEFLTNVECLEGLFDTWGVFGRGFNGDLEKGGPKPRGARKANLTERTRPFLEEVALNEQGHALFTRHAGSRLPCPLIDFDEGFNALMAVAYNLSTADNGNSTKLIIDEFGAAFDPFKNDQNFALSVLALEEVGARGNKGGIGLFSNPVLAAGQAGLATSACSQATSERRLLWDMRDEIVEPFNETVQQVFARVSAARDYLDGPPVDDQGLVNTDPRTIAVPTELVNMVPTDHMGLTFAMTPQQVLRIVTVAARDAKGGFFPEGPRGRINSWVGYDKIDPKKGLGEFPRRPEVGTAAPARAAGTPPPPPGKLPRNVTDQLALTQGVKGPLDNGTFWTRGYNTPENQKPFFTTEERVEVAENGRRRGREEREKRDKRKN